MFGGFCLLRFVFVGWYVDSEFAVVNLVTVLLFWFCCFGLVLLVVWVSLFLLFACCLLCTYPNSSVSYNLNKII